MEFKVNDTFERWLYDPLTGKLVFVLIGLVLIAVVVRLLRSNLSRMVREDSARYKVRKGINFIAYFAAAVLVALVFSDKLGGFTVAFGVAGAGIAFALQEVIASVAGWVAVTMGGFYKTGDRVQLGGIRGDVIDIGILRTTLMQIGDWVNADQYNGRIVRVANSFVFKEPVFNYSSDFPFLWDEIMLPIKYGSDHRLARQIIERTAQEVVGEYVQQAQEAWIPMTQKYLVEPASVQPMVSMLANQNWIEFTLRYVVDYKLRRVTKDRLFTRLLEEIDRHAERVGIAAATLNIEKHAPIEVRLTRATSTSERGDVADDREVRRERENKTFQPHEVKYRTSAQSSIRMKALDLLSCLAGPWPKVLPIRVIADAPGHATRRPCPQQVWLATLASHQLTRWSTS